jgi:hypothetical protein
MSGISLYDFQLEAVKKMHNGCILCGDVGSGKSRTSLAYYCLQQNRGGDTIVYWKMPPKIEDLYIITTARKRDTFEWDSELANFRMSTNPENDAFKHSVVIDSWNNIHKYKNVKGAFFIFDEQRVVGRGEWVKSFLKITKVNHWILLSATPGDKWEDYIPVFVANGFYKNRTQFYDEHVIWDPRVSFPKIRGYFNTNRLIRLRDRVLVQMDDQRTTIPHHEDVFVAYDISAYRELTRTRWNPWLEKPIETASELCYAWRKVVNSDDSRQIAVLEILEDHPKAIIFYNFDYELEILREIGYEEGTEIAEWNGHKHDALPTSNKWVYLVQYTAGCEGWNCITTDTIIFFSQNYSYKVQHQAEGRINRLNTPYQDLYYYHLRSRSGIDLAIHRALMDKKTFNEGAFTKRAGYFKKEKSS